MYGVRLLRQRSVQLAALTILAVVVLAFRALQFTLFTRQIQFGYDFSAYWYAGSSVLAGLSPYAPFQLAGPYSPQQQFLYLYPPPLAAAMAPIAWFFPRDYHAAAWIWTIVGAAILVAVVLELWRSERLGERFPILAGPGRWLLVAAAFAFPPVVGELVLGNVHLLLLGLLTLAWLGVRRGDTRGQEIAGLAVGAAAVVKVFPAVLILWFLLTRRYTAAAGVVVGVIVLGLITQPITGIEPWLQYPTVLANLGPPTDTRDTLAPTVWLAEGIGFNAARVIVTLAGAAIVVWAALRASSRDAGDDEGDTARSFGVAVTVAVLIAPALYQHYLAVLVLPLLLGLAARVPLPLLSVAYLLMWGGQQEALGDASWIVNRALPTAGALLLLVAFLVPPTRRAALPDTAFAEATPR